MTSCQWNSRECLRVLSNAGIALCLLGLVACTPANQQAANQHAANKQPASTQSASELPAQAKPEDTKPAAADAPPAAGDSMNPPTAGTSAPNQPASDGSLSQWNGYGDTRFGMDEAAFRAAWQGELSDYPFEDKASCFHLWPKGQKTSAALAFMFGDGKFVRYSSENPKLRAPGGGRIGMPRSEIDALYAGRVKAQPHKYTDGEYLRINEGKRVLIFATDAAGKVTEWRVGVPPFVDYVEGCA